MPTSNNFMSFVLEKQYALIYQDVVWHSFRTRNNKKYLKIDIYLIHSSTLPFQAIVTIT